MTQTDPTTAIYDALARLQGGPHHLPPGTRKAIAEHLAATLPASAVVYPPTSRAELRDRIRRVLCERDGKGYLWGTDMLEPDEYGDHADAVLAVLGEQTDRAAVPALVDTLIERCPDHGCVEPSWGDGCHCEIAPLLRRLAVEAHGTETQQQDEARPVRGDQFEAWLKTQRDAYGPGSLQWPGLDDALDRYRLHADTGTPLSEHVCEGRVAGDCECLEPAPVAEQPAAADDEETRRG